MGSRMTVEHVHVKRQPRVGVEAEPDRDERLAVMAHAGAGPGDRQVIREHDGKIDDVFLPGRFDQPRGQRVADDGERTSLA